MAILFEMTTKTNVSRKCKVCGNEFKITNGRQKHKIYCSKKCIYKQFNTLKYGNKCMDCGKIINKSSLRCSKCFIKHRDISGSRNGRWRGGTSEGYQIRIYRNIVESAGIDLNRCDRCGNTHRRMVIHHKNKDHSDNSLSNLRVLCTLCHSRIHIYKKVDAKCDNCGKVFKLPPYKTKINKHHYCSRECFKKHKSILYTGRPSPRNAQVEIICLNCGKVFKVSPCYSNKAKYCCRACCYAHRKMDTDKMREWSKNLYHLKMKKKHLPKGGLR